ncbi:MAG: hypothetical protein KA198_00075 [Chitinophagaceae bacterium]|nr:hypothetical protein [Chitinophagaceae bacterium]
MKKGLFTLASILLISQFSQAQLYSSGNNVIGGTSVGIGTNAPVSSSKLHVYSNSAVTNELIRMQQALSTSFGRFTMYNDNASNYATFTKYGSSVTSGYPGITTQYPYANLLAFGNNGGGFLISNGGNIGISLFKSATSKLKFHVNYNTENVGIGGAAEPITNIHVNSAVSGDTLKITNSTTGHNATDGLDIRTTGNAASIVNRESSTLSFGTANTSRMSISSTGTVSIGTVTEPAGYKLYVETGILTEKVKVALKTSGNWADYVFADDYKLLPLKQVESFVKENKHLPNVPSAEEVVKSGIDVATMDAKLLEKIEELTLYIIQLQKQVDELKEAGLK